MVSEQTRNDVWQELLDVTRLVRYYGALSDRHRRNHTAVRFLLLAAAAGGIAALLDLLPQIVQLVAGGLIALLVAWDFVSDYAKKAAVLHTIDIECGLLEIEWRELWNEANDPEASDAEVREKNRRLAERISYVTARAGDADIPENRKLNEECAKAAYRVVADQYAA